MSIATTDLPLTLDCCGVRDTAAHAGRTRAVLPLFVVVVNVHPDFNQGGSGLEAGRAVK